MLGQSIGQVINHTPTPPPSTGSSSYARRVLACMYTRTPKLLRSQTIQSPWRPSPVGWRPLLVGSNHLGFVPLCGWSMKTLSTSWQIGPTTGVPGASVHGGLSQVLALHRKDSTNKSNLPHPSLSADML